MRFQDKVVVITGGAQGLGAYYAKRFANEGASIAICDVLDCAQALSELPANSYGDTCDITDAAATQNFITKAAEALGGVDILINNAALYGALNFGPFDQIDEAEWDACMHVNVKGIWQMSKAVAPYMKEKGGSIVNVASLAATFGMPYGVHYSASKGAVIGLTRSLAREVARYNIRVNAIAPSLIDTPGTQGFLKGKADKVRDAVVSGQAMREQVTQEDVAGAVMFLASDDAKHMTGQTLAVDGGTVML
ncbi:MAG: SDR family NAD(P)-dependent oxidoreductase [Sphingomonadales bacterium]|jgi:3-oxoacyl-[acyl-carrier protein] reductase